MLAEDCLENAAWCHSRSSFFFKTHLLQHASWMVGDGVFAPVCHAMLSQLPRCLPVFRAAVHPPAPACCASKNVAHCCCLPSIYAGMMPARCPQLFTPHAHSHATGSDRSWNDESVSDSREGVYSRTSHPPCGAMCVHVAGHVASCGRVCRVVQNC